MSLSSSGPRRKGTPKLWLKDLDRDRVAFALQQGGVREIWLEQWWLWPLVRSV